LILIAEARLHHLIHLWCDFFIPLVTLCFLASTSEILPGCLLLMSRQLRPLPAPLFTYPRTTHGCHTAGPALPAASCIGSWCHSDAFADPSVVVPTDDQPCMVMTESTERHTTRLWRRLSSRRLFQQYWRNVRQCPATVCLPHLPRRGHSQPAAPRASPPQGCVAADQQQRAVSRDLDRAARPGAGRTD